MNTKTARLAVSVALLWSGLATAQVPQTSPPYTPYSPYPVQSPSPYSPYPGSPEMGAQTPKNPLLLALVVQPILQQMGVSVSGGIGQLFGRLFSALSGHHANADGTTPQYPGGAQGYSYPQPPAYGASYPQAGGYSATPGAVPGSYTPPYGAPAGSYQPGVPGAVPGSYTSPYGASAPAAPYPAGAANMAPVQNPANAAYPYGSSPSAPTTYAPGTSATVTPPGTAAMPPGAVGTSTGMTPGTPGAVPGNYPSPYGSTAATSPYPTAATSVPGVQNPSATYPSSTSPAPSNMYVPGMPGAVAMPGATAASATSTYPPQSGASLPAGTAMPAGGAPATTLTSSLPPGSKSAVVPSVLYSLDQLDPKKYTARRHIDVAGSVPTLHTGDVFAIEYSTNLPGQLRIENIDSAGKTTDLGTYTMRAGRDNRIPITKGIKLVGETGIETFKMYFFPCVPADPQASAGASGSEASLPVCPARPSPQLLKASQGLIASKGAVNLESPDPTIAIAAVTDYQPDDVMVNDFRIQHVAQATSQAQGAPQQ
jgi:hypothetical protein